MIKEFQKSAVPSLLQFARVRAAHQPHVICLVVYKPLNLSKTNQIKHNAPSEAQGRGLQIK